MLSARLEGGIGAGGRKTLAGATGAALVALTRLVKGSALFGSAGFSTGFGSASLGSTTLGSTSLGSEDDVSASTGRGRGNGLAGADAGGGITTTEPNIGDGWRPACRNSALAMMALTAAKASAPAIMSFGLYSRIRIARPRSASASIAAAPRRRRGLSLSSAICLGTFFHLMGLVFRLVFRLVLGCGSRRRVKRGDIAWRRCRRRHERQRQRHGHGGAFVDLALHRYLAGMHPDQAFHDRQPEAGAFVPPLVGLAGLEEGIPDPLEIVGRDADTGIGDAQQQPRALDGGGNRYPAAALGELDGIGDKVQHDLLERARIAGHDRQILQHAGRKVDPALPRLQRQEVAAIDQRGPRRERLRREFETAGLHLRHVENAVDDRQQMLAGIVDQLGIFLAARREIGRAS